MFPKNWVFLLVSVEPKDTTKPKIRRRKDLLLLAAGKENTGDLAQSSVFLNSWRSIKLRVHAYSRRGLGEQSLSFS